MSTIIQIKRNSGTTAPATSDLVIGEMAYAYDASNDGVSGKLYIEAVNSSNAALIHTIGGKYFTDLLDHTKGTVTANSALLVDANKKLNELLVDNITIDGSDISSSNSNGNITLTPNGTGSVVINKNDGFRLPVGNTSQRLASPTSGQIRYNSQIAAFEGYAASSWGTLGGVIDVDQDTKITAESAAGQDEDVLTFTAGGTALATFDANSADFASGTVVNVTNQLNVDNLRFDGNAITSTNSNGDITISPNGTGNVSIGSDSLLIESAASETATVGIYAGEAAAALLVMSADDGDDNGDDWTFTAGTNNTLAIGNDISGSLVSQIVLTPHATVASSTTAIVGALTVAGVTTFSGAVNMGSQATTNVNIDSGAIDAVTIGTNSAVTDLRVDNLKLDGNTVSSTDSNGNVIIAPNGTGNVVLNTDTLSISATEGEAATLLFQTDEGDDNGDDWTITNTTANKLTFNNDISGSVVELLSLTPHATAASSTAAFAGHVTIAGDLTITGATTTASSTNTVITDKLIELANGASGSASGDVGLVLERGSEANVFIGWDESINALVVGTGTFTGSTTGDLSHTLAAAKFGSLTLTTDLAVAEGGTGVSSFSNNGVLYGDGSNALDVTATPGAADATTSFQILSASSSNGVPVWTTSIDGGTY
jgi:hypothetical protein|tara:strand:- start:542 stop:2506 length:1965 start_codon:yes stop_codon:yes gene_type:complete